MAPNQVLEVVAEETKPLRPYEELLSVAPSDGSQAEKLERIRAQQEAEEQLEAARQRVSSPDLSILFTTLKISPQ